MSKVSWPEAEPDLRPALHQIPFLLPFPLYRGLLTEVGENKNLNWTVNHNFNVFFSPFYALLPVTSSCGEPQMAKPAWPAVKPIDLVLQGRHVIRPGFYSPFQKVSIKA